MNRKKKQEVKTKKCKKSIKKLPQRGVYKKLYCLCRFLLHILLQDNVFRIVLMERHTGLHDLDPDQPAEGCVRLDQQFHSRHQPHIRKLLSAPGFWHYFYDRSFCTHRQIRQRSLAVHRNRVFRRFGGIAAATTGTFFLCHDFLRFLRHG